MSANGDHVCRFDWCVNDVGGWPAAQLEHFTIADQIPATGVELNGGQRVPVVGFSLRFNEDTDPAPWVCLYTGENNPEIGLTLPQAIVLVDRLQRLVEAAIRGTNLDPEKVLG